MIWSLLSQKCSDVYCISWLWRTTPNFKPQTFYQSYAQKKFIQVHWKQKAVHFEAISFIASELSAVATHKQIWQFVVLFSTLFPHFDLVRTGNPAFARYVQANGIICTVLSYWISLSKSRAKLQGKNSLLLRQAKIVLYICAKQKLFYIYFEKSLEKCLVWNNFWIEVF